MKKVNKKSSNKRKNNLKNVFKFYNDNIKKKHIICYIISLILFAAFFTYFINRKIDFKEIIEQSRNIGRFKNAFINKLLLMFAITFSGVTPYFYIPVIGLVGMSCVLALNICSMHVVNMILTSIFCVFQLFFSSLAVACGIYICNMYTKKFIYQQKLNFTFADIKQRFLELTKSEKLEAYKEKRLKKRMNFEKLNVKVDYKNTTILTIIASVFVILFTLISGV